MSPAVTSVGLIVGNLDEGAFRSVGLALAAGFVKAGIAVDVAYLKGDAASFRSALHPGARLVKLGASRSLLSTAAVARYMRANRPDAVVTIGWLQNVPGAIARKLARYDGVLVLTEHGHMSHEAAVEHGDKLLWRNMPRVVRRVYPWADALVAVDRGVLEDLRDRVRVDLSRLATGVIPNPVDVDAVAVAGAQGRDRVSSDDPLIVTVGRLSPQKNQRLLVEAFARLGARTTLAIVGDGPERSALEDLVARLGVGDRVTFTGHVANPHAYSAAADLFVLPSDVEGCPLALIEALACGCPSIATDCAPGPRDILGGGEFGVLVPPGDAAALATAMTELLADDQRRRHLSEQGRRRALDFTVDKAMERWLSFLQRLRRRAR